jgi:hypothetical protein
MVLSVLYGLVGTNRSMVPRCLRVVDKVKPVSLSLESRISVSKMRP